METFDEFWSHGRCSEDDVHVLWHILSVSGLWNQEGKWGPKYSPLKRRKRQIILLIRCLRVRDFIVHGRASSKWEAVLPTINPDIWKSLSWLVSALLLKRAGLKKIWIIRPYEIILKARALSSSGREVTVPWVQNQNTLMKDNLLENLVESKISFSDGR